MRDQLRGEKQSILDYEMGIVIAYCAGAVHAHGYQSRLLQRLLLHTLERYIAHQALSWMLAERLQSLLRGYDVRTHD